MGAACLDHAHVIIASTVALALTLGLHAPEAPPEGQPHEGRLALRMVYHFAQTSRRARLWEGALSTGFGAAQVGIGSWGLASGAFSPVMKRSAFAQLLLGTAEVSMGVYALARPSAMERLAASPEAEALRRDPADEPARRRLEARWSAARATARTWRLVVGSGYLAGGLTLSGLGSAILLSPSWERAPVQRLWAYTTLGTGIGLMASGALKLGIASSTERAHAAYAAASGPPDARERRRVTLAPTIGGAVLSGRF